MTHLLPTDRLLAASSADVRNQLEQMRTTVLDLAQTIEDMLPSIEATARLTGHGTAWLGSYRQKIKQARKLARTLPRKETR